MDKNVPKKNYRKLGNDNHARKRQGDLKDTIPDKQRKQIKKDNERKERRHNETKQNDNQWNRQLAK